MRAPAQITPKLPQAESLFHELLLQSPHRTLDPEEADFFYVPAYTSCYMWPVHAWADYPFWHSHGGVRTQQQAPGAGPQERAAQFVRALLAAAQIMIAIAVCKHHNATRTVPVKHFVKHLWMAKGNTASYWS
jgi:hypothetical protein